MAKRNNGLFRLFRRRSNSILTTVTTILVLLVILFAFISWFIHGLSLKVEKDNKVKVTETEILALRDIGEWEFLSISDEELIDTVRHGLFGDSELIRIYYGTLHLGIDMSEINEHSITVKGDTITAYLPPIRLLDDNFIDEARTKSFFQKGKWSHQDRARLYEKARRQMLKQCLTESNMKSARNNAVNQFEDLFKAMGFNTIRIRFSDDDRLHK